MISDSIAEPISFDRSALRRHAAPSAGVFLLCHLVELSCSRLLDRGKQIAHIPVGGATGLRYTRRSVDGSCLRGRRGLFCRQRPGLQGGVDDGIEFPEAVDLDEINLDR